MPNTKLTDLPIDLQSNILLNLAPWIFPERTPCDCTVQSAELFSATLPDSLLNAAQASRELSRSVIHALGSHAKFLNFDRSHRLPEWISLLKDQVKAVSLTGSLDFEYNRTNGGNLKCYYSSNIQHMSILRALTALYTNDVALEALDLQELSETDPKRAKETAEHAIMAIQKSSSSLREVAVSINGASVLAMPHVTLPNLNVAQISSHVAMSGTRSSAKAFGDVLNAISGNADRHADVCTVRNLRLINLQESPTVDHERCFSLFLAVKELFITSFTTPKHNEIAKFIANFRNLKSLGWFTKWTCPEDMDAIFAGCPDLENLEIFVTNKRILPDAVDTAQNSPRLKDLFVSFRGKQRGIGLNAHLSYEQVLCLAQSSPKLNSLEMEVDSENLETLSPLLDTHCRELAHLRLVYSHDAINHVGRDVWCVLSQAICSASDELRMLSIVTNRRNWVRESAVYDMIDAVIDMLKFMGDRASYIMFRFSIKTHNLSMVLEAFRDILTVAKNHNRSLRVLCLEFIPRRRFHEYSIDFSENHGLLDLLRAVSDLRREFESFRDPVHVHLGDLDAVLGKQGITWN